MSSPKPNQAHRPRELRRRVLVAARLRDGVSWSDACIVNISSHGLLIHSSKPVAAGAQVEIRRGDHAIAARVVWRDGAQAGLQCERPLPVEDIMTLGQSPALKLTAAASAERRRQPRSHEQNRLRGRLFEFAGTAVIAIALAGAVLSMVEQAFARPVALVSAALGR